jgi:hypothetical protein
MNDKISPKYLMSLIANVQKALLAEFKTNQLIGFYLSKWIESDYNGNWQNFQIVTYPSQEIDLPRTLHGIEGETLIKIAIDLGVETPDFIPSIPQFKVELKEKFKSAFESFQKATKHIEEHPDVAIGLANSTLESIIKEILKDDRIATKYDKTQTLYQLTEAILKEFRFYPNSTLPDEIRSIGSSLLNMNKNIEKLRSEKTVLHGKTEDDYIITDTMYAYFVVNSVSTIGLFLNSFYREKFQVQAPIAQQQLDDDLPF